MRLHPSMIPNYSDKELAHLCDVEPGYLEDPLVRAEFGNRLERRIGEEDEIDALELEVSQLSSKVDNLEEKKVLLTEIAQDCAIVAKKLRENEDAHAEFVDDLLSAVEEVWV